MKTDLETMIGYLAGRDGQGDAGLRAELDDPSSEASRFLEAARRRTRALIADGPVDEPRPAPLARRPRHRRVAMVAGAVALVLISALIPLGFGAIRERRLREALTRAESDAREQAVRLEAALARTTPRPASTPPTKPREEPIALALNRVEAGLGKRERRLDDLSRPAPAPPAIESPPPLGPDPSLGEIRAEIAAIRRETASSEQANARQLQEMRTVLQELNQIVRRAVSGPRSGLGVPMPMMMPNAMPNMNFGQDSMGLDPAQVQALIHRLSSPHPHVRLEAAENLSQLGPAARTAVPELRQMLPHESDVRVKAAAQSALNHLQRD